MNPVLLIVCLSTFLGYRIDSLAQTAQSPDYGFNRIVHGWSNYSTAFSITHDHNSGGEFATAGCLYTPVVNTRPTEFSAIVIWFGSSGQPSFQNFTFKVLIWDSVNAFIRDPHSGSLGTLPFTMPTGGSTTLPDATTRGGRPAYHIAFNLDACLVLTQCHTYVVGLVATAMSSQAGELFVPTAAFDGESDVQAGNIVPFGWQYLIDAGGTTLYSGQLATALAVQPLDIRPTLTFEPNNTSVRLTWPATANCYTLESANTISTWSTATNSITTQSGISSIIIQPSETSHFFRLVKPPASIFAP